MQAGGRKREMGRKEGGRVELLVRCQQRPSLPCAVAVVLSQQGAVPGYQGGEGGDHIVKICSEKSNMQHGGATCNM